MTTEKGEHPQRFAILLARSLCCPFQNTMKSPTGHYDALYGLYDALYGDYDALSSHDNE
jgi:hypothetical protein